jgi:hypothetical protein
MESLFDTAAASLWLGEHGISRTPKTLRKLRCTGGGPRFRRLGNQPVYTVPDLERWVEALLSEPASNNAEAAAPALRPRA